MQCFYRTCPAVKANRDALFSASPGSAKAVLSVRNRDNDIRKNSSSGGLFTALSDYVLAQGGVVCGAVWLDGLSVGHICAVNAEDRNRMRQSKYVQSDIGCCFREIRTYLNSGKTVLFTGLQWSDGGFKAFLRTRIPESDSVRRAECGEMSSRGLV